MSDSTPVIIVTGGSRGLGRGICLKLSESGYSVVINFVGNAEAAEKTVAECHQRKTLAVQKFIALQADIGRADDRRNLVDSIMRKLGRIDALINNAGIAPRDQADILDATEGSFERYCPSTKMGEGRGCRTGRSRPA